MVSIAPIVEQDVDVHARLAGEAVEEVPDQLGAEATDGGTGEGAVEDAMAAPADIYGDGREGLVHRHDGVRGAADTAPVAERLAERLAEADRHILDGVV